MPRVFTKTIEQMRSEAIEALQDGGKITNVSPTSVARQLVDVGIETLSTFFDAVEFHNRMSQLSTATGIFLDLIGQSRGLVRSEAVPASVSTEDRAIRFFSKDGSTPLKDLLLTGVIPINSLVTSADSEIVFTVLRTVGVDDEQTEVYVPAVSAEVGADFNVGVNTLVAHDLGVGTVGVTNDITITSGADSETDSNYRFRISRAIDLAAGATQDAVRLAAFAFPGVAEVILRPFPNGVGSFEVLVVPIANELPAGLLQSIEAVVRNSAAFGTAVTVRLPDRLEVELTVQIDFQPATTPNQRVQLRAQVKNNVLLYIGSIPLGGEFVVNELVQRVMETSDLIRDMRVLVYRFRGEPYPTKNIRGEEDELFVPSASVSEAVRVV